MSVEPIPSASTPPANATPSAVRKLIMDRVLTRRSVLRGVLTTGMVLGISALDLLPGRNRAEAWLYGSHPWQIWTHCADYSTSTRRTNWRWCNPASARVSSRFCQRAYNRHRTDGERRTDCEYEDFRRDYRCWNLSDSRVINAWVWRRGQTGGDIDSVICSDGRTYVYNSCGSDYEYKSVCRRYLS
ncbi:hypothetical protein ABN034_11785 [Actinopolymorpha sp. B11F2]|uniref:hypothetical protein n=1 Tax=Actinopolymorpha sp. B11F2 TaxID=3160862 RepID=UPI0032E3C5D0